MGHSGHNEKLIHLVSIRFVVVMMVLSCVGLFAASRALAAFEQTGTFGGSAVPVLEEHFSEEAQLGGVSGMAVNATGAGGMSAGTVYAAIRSDSTAYVTVFKPNAEGTLTFSEAWVVGSFPGEPSMRCGPEGEPAHPHCSIPQTEGGAVSLDVEVDQITGNVYVYDGVESAPGKKYIVEYSPNGEKEITRFGEEANFGETTAESPEKIHDTSNNNIAVDGAGNVYLFDANRGGDRHDRLMVFGPQSPGDFEHYVYTGEVEAESFGTVDAMPAVDSTGHVYGVQSGEIIKEFAPGTPSEYPAAATSPICSFKFARAGIYSMTVDPVSGEVFFFSYKTPKSVYRLGPCDEATGQFAEASPAPEAFGVTPERAYLYAMAFDPMRVLELSRGPGVLYAGAPGPFSGLGTGEPGQSALGYIFSHAREVAPSVGAESVSNVGVTGGVLHASVDPHGFDTHYRFQFLTAAEYEANPVGEHFANAGEAPVGGGVVQGGSGVQSIAVAVGGLVPDTEYRYRVVATSECTSGKVCEDTGEVESFRTFPVELSGLPDHRVYEMVSPAQKYGGQVWPAEPEINSCGVSELCKPGGSLSQPFPMQGAPDGDSVVYEGSPFSVSEGSVGENEYIARRDPQKGWQTVNLTPSLLVKDSGKYVAFADGLGEGLLFQPGGADAPALSEGVPSEYGDLYAQDTNGTTGFVPLVTTEPPNRSPEEFRLEYAGHSADFSRLFFTANDALTEAMPFAPSAVDGGANENNLYEWNDGRLHLVNVLPGNTETEPGAVFGSVSPDAHAISVDGDRVFWSSASGQVYVRENGESTRELPDHTGRFLSASSDGSRVLLSDGHLYDLRSETTVDLTGEQGGFQGVVGQSEDLSHVYFVDTAALTVSSEENANHEHAVTGGDNLYAWHEGSTRFVAVLLPEDNTSRPKVGDWQSSPTSRTAQASPAGRYLAFVSNARLTGYDNTGPCSAANDNNHLHYVPGPCSEVFLYDSVTDGLVCASCDPSGAPPLGKSVLRMIAEGTYTYLPQPRYLTDQGRLFFDSQDSLTPADTNKGVEDVYEYEPRGAGALGSCEREAGCVFLISAGTGSTDSNFLWMDEEGKNVFFTTRDQLSRKDHDDLIDLYDAREGGGTPAETEAAPRECQGETCLPPLPAGPQTEILPDSNVFNGPGNHLQALPAGVPAQKKGADVLTRSERLTKELRACHRLSKRRRKRCEGTVRKRYSPKTKRKPKTSSKGGKRS